MAAWLDEKMGDDGDLWHGALIDPTLLRIVGPVSGLQVLDLACGNGYLSRRFAKMGARVIGVDSSAPIVERTRRREAETPLGIIYHVDDAAQLEVLGDGGVDLVVSNMALMDIEDATGAVRAVSRVLRPGGRFVASLSHPCFDIMQASAWVVERMDFTTIVWRKVSRYREFFTGQTPWRTEPDPVYTPAYHRPLSWYIRTLRAAQFVITAFEEPDPTEELLSASAQGAWIAQIPLHCVIGARKEGS